MVKLNSIHFTPTQKLRKYVRPAVIYTLVFVVGYYTGNFRSEPKVTIDDVSQTFLNTLLDNLNTVRYNKEGLTIVVDRLDKQEQEIIKLQNRIHVLEFLKGIKPQKDWRLPGVKN